MRKNQSFRPLAGGAEKQGGEINAVERFGSDASYPREFRQRGEQIDRPGDLRHHSARRDMTRPADEKGSADAAFISGAFAAFHSAVPAPAVRTVVGKINYNRVVAQFQLVEPPQYPSDVVIEVLRHREHAARHRHIFLLT